MSTLARQSATKPDNRPEWVRYLEGYCGVKTYNQWRDWTDFITEGQGGLDSRPTDDELLAVVKFVAERENIGGITARKLAGWVKWYRKERYADRQGYSRDTREGRMDEVWQMMTRARDHAERWELLVEGGKPILPAADGGYAYRQDWTDRERGELSSRARGRWPDWDQAVSEYMARLTETQHVVFSDIAKRVDIKDVVEVPF